MEKIDRETDQENDQENDHENYHENYQENDVEEESDKEEQTQKNEKKIFVGGLDFEHTTSETLHEHFSKYGDIVEAVVIKDKNTGKSKGYGFVTYVKAEYAKQALSVSNPVIDGRKANVNMATALYRTPTTSTSRYHNYYNHYYNRYHWNNYNNQHNQQNNSNATSNNSSNNNSTNTSPISTASNSSNPPPLSTSLSSPSNSNVVSNSVGSPTSPKSNLSSTATTPSSSNSSPLSSQQNFNKGLYYYQPSPPNSKHSHHFPVHYPYLPPTSTHGSSSATYNNGQGFPYGLPPPGIPIFYIPYPTGDNIDDVEHEGENYVYYPPQFYPYFEPEYSMRNSMPQAFPINNYGFSYFPMVGIPYGIPPQQQPSKSLVQKDSTSTVQN